jgi:DNA-binding XRE family transcriptional regulator
MAKVTHGVMRWADEQLAQDSALRERVEARLAELRLEQDLVALREARGLTQAQTARLLGVSQPAIAKLESGRENLTVRTLVKMVTALGGDVAIRIRKTAPAGRRQTGTKRLVRVPGRAPVTSR